MLVNEYDVTKKMFLQWARQSRQRPARIVMTTLWALLFFLTFSLFIISTANIFLILALFCVYRAFFQEYVIALRLYKKNLSTYGENAWHRKISISGEDIVINSGNITVTYKTSDIVKIVQRENLIRLFMNDKSSIRLYKDSFVEGNWEDYENILTPTAK